MPLPTFLIIGAAKAGTTTLYHHLRQHPDVFMSANKEPRFFAFEGMTFDPRDPVHRTTVTDFESYRSLFDNVTDEIAIGEASPSYLSNSVAAERIARYIPDAKLVAILRNPVERAWSHFLHAKLHNLEPESLTFEQVVRDHASLQDSNNADHPYIRMGFYGRQLVPYFDRFDDNQLKIYFFEDLRSDEIGLVRSLYRFLGVDDTFETHSGTQHAKTGLPKNPLLHQILQSSRRAAGWMRPLLPNRVRESLGKARTKLMNDNLSKPEMPREVRADLVETYRDDVLHLQDLLDRDLSRWLRV